jgi:hypothetical protein
MSGGEPGGGVVGRIPGAAAALSLAGSVRGIRVPRVSATALMSCRPPHEQCARLQREKAIVLLGFGLPRDFSGLFIKSTQDFLYNLLRLRGTIPKLTE